MSFGGLAMVGVGQSPNECRFFELYCRVFVALVQVNAKDDLKIGNSAWTPDNASELAKAALKCALAASDVYDNWRATP